MFKHILLSDLSTTHTNSIFIPDNPTSTFVSF